ncbi:MAG: S8 family serine peptidase, partial [Anaerolineales bacterium]|nr:S8 family serine peptidase [Anaerolineales bacterium]
KNVITVGASESVRTGSNASTWGAWWPTEYPVAPIFADAVANNADGLAAFSSRGPTLSNRLKPDIVAPGTNIVSTRNYSTGTGWGVFDANYLYMGGTSMATPLVAGAAAIVREYYTTTHSIDPTAALVKATFINGAVDMTPGQYGGGATQEIIRRPDNAQGWGRVDLPNTLIYTGNRQLWFHEHAGLNTSDSYQATFKVLNSGPFRATLVWTDYQGTEASFGALVNDLDLVVEDPNGTLYLGNEVLVGGRDATNNVEGVDLMPINGTYTVTVSGFNVPQGPQPFALVVTADVASGPVGYVTGLIDDGVNPIAAATVTAVPTTTVSPATSGTGIYTLTLPVGTYDLTAEATGYLPSVVNSITIISGTTTTQDFTLVQPPAPTPFSKCVVPNVAIPDANPAGINNTLTITQTAGISDLNLYIRATHTWVGDLRFTLTHPNNSTSATVINRPGTGTLGCSENNINVWVDDEGTDTAIDNQCNITPPAAIRGRAIGGAPPSATLLATFDGLSANGVWRLNAADNESDDTGTLNEWCVEITPIPDYIWRGIEDSDWNNANNWAGGAVPGATDSIVLDPTYLTGAMVWPVLEMDPTVNNLTVAADAELTIPAGRTLTVNGTMTNNGTLRQSIDNVNALTTFLGMGGYGGVEITPAGNMGLTTVVIRGNQNCTTDNSSAAVQRCFDIAPTTDQVATIRFYYLPGEANGNAENGVGVYHWNGAGWDLEAGTVTHSSGADPRWVQVTGVSNYSPFVLDDVAPTAVSLSQLDTNSNPTLPLATIALLLLLLTSTLGWRAIKQR